MTPRSTSQRWLAPAVFGLAALAFLLPFATVSCNSAQTTFTGIQLVTETVPSGGVTDNGQALGDRVEDSASQLAMAALASAVVGFILSVLGAHKGPGWLAAAGLVSILLLGAKALEPFGPTIEFHPGYWLTLLLFLCASWLYASRALRRRRAARRASAAPEIQSLREEAP